MAKILLVDDDRPIAQLVADRLVRAGHAVSTVHDGATGLEEARSFAPDLVLLDVMLPTASGLEVCLELRRRPGPQPIVVMLTAKRAEEDALAAFESGADDYVRKPFGVAELVHRVGALLSLARRSQGSDAPLRRGEITIRRDARVVSVRSEVIRLTPKEFDLLVHLAEHAGVTIGRERLLREVWGYAHAGYARTIDSHVTRIRRKLSAAGEVGDPITTVHGVGYRWEAGE